MVHGLLALREPLNKTEEKYRSGRKHVAFLQPVLQTLTDPTGTTMPRTKSRRRYQPVLELPPLPSDDAAALRANIALNGVLVPILVDEDRRIIDGSYRKRFADELGYDCPEVVQEGLIDTESGAYPSLVVRNSSERNGKPVQSV